MEHTSTNAHNCKHTHSHPRTRTHIHIHTHAHTHTHTQTHRPERHTQTQKRGREMMKIMKISEQFCEQLIQSILLNIKT
jgi:hypothetical protein